MISSPAIQAAFQRLRGPEALRLARFAGVSLFCAALHNLIVIGATLAGWGYVAGALLSYAVLVPTSYAINVRVVFRSEASVRSFLLFAATLVLNVPGTVALLFLFHDRMGAPIIMASPAVSVVMFAWNYVAARLITAGDASPVRLWATRLSSRRA